MLLVKCNWFDKLLFPQHTHTTRTCIYSGQVYTQPWLKSHRLSGLSISNWPISSVIIWDCVRDNVWHFVGGWTESESGRMLVWEWSHVNVKCKCGLMQSVQYWMAAPSNGYCFIWDFQGETIRLCHVWSSLIYGSFKYICVSISICTEDCSIV